VIVKAKRTPIGKKDGLFRHIEAHLLAAPLLSHLASGVEREIDDVILGNVVGPGGNIARLTALEAGLPLSIPGMTIDRQCSAGLEAIRTACHFIQGNAGRCYLAGGTESASTSPFPARARFSPDKIGDPDMGVAAELVAQKFAISKDMQDEYARLSYQRSWRAYREGVYDQEIIGLEGRSVDECFLKERNIGALLKRAKPIFVKENGTVTAANSCSINDGAAAVLVMEEELASKLKMRPLLRFLDSQVSAVHPHFPGISPVPAISELLERNHLTVEDIGLFEINEAFASKIAACARELSIPYEKINVSGGALTIGHPYGGSGAVLVTRLFYEAQRRKKVNYAVAAIGSAGGVGLAVLFEVI
jgi:acetyl-CoA C-acetyltransferase